ncbi:oligosaccharide flippase family protein [Sphingomonas sp. Sphisp140]|uniref:oligosaccharide flippase family protein n=1 Tax=unclassified Sphingomonas TaxID=196159 RepID=UPI0039AEADD6
MDRRQYLKHFMVLFSGTAGAQLANLASYPLLGRLYSPVDFGVFAMFVAVSAIPGAIACGRFDLAVPTAPKAGRYAIYWLCLAIAAGMGLVSTVGSALYWGVTGAGVSPVLPLMLGLCVFLTGFCAASSLYLMRHDAYRLNSASLLLRTGGTVLVQIGLAFVWRDPMSLIVGFTAGFAAQALLLAWAVWRFVPPRRPRLSQMRAMFARYRRQVTVDIPSTFIAAVSLNLLTFLLLSLYGEQAVGYYSLGNRIAILPLQLFNDALSQVFFQKAARAQEERGDFWNEMKFNVIASGLLSIGVLCGVWLLAKPFITIYLGQRWAPAGDILIILAPMLAVRSLCMSIGTTVFVLRRAHWLLLHNIANAAVLGIAYLIARASGLELNSFLWLAAGLLIVEYGAFALWLILAAWRGRKQPVSGPLVARRVSK